MIRTDKLSGNNESIAPSEHTGINKAPHGHSPEAVSGFNEGHPTGADQLLTKLSSSGMVACSTIFVMESLTEKFRSRTIDAKTLAFYTAINCMTLLIGIYKKAGQCNLGEDRNSLRGQSPVKYTHRNIGADEYLQLGYDSCLSSNYYSFRKNTTTNKIMSYGKIPQSASARMHIKAIRRKQINRPVYGWVKLPVDPKSYLRQLDNNAPYSTDQLCRLHLMYFMIDRYWNNVCKIMPFCDSRTLIYQLPPYFVYKVDSQENDYKTR
ncbi:hypothetical protein C1646_660976 [Rhizophagus diaphanus]|nr:hypothetical protein C1646_660976 [Rhizophagus diaphanus] [Rhizophagus sp. MUCL 43196]